MTSDSVFSTLALVWKALERAGIDAALMGGLAVSAWGYFRGTRDVATVAGRTIRHTRHLSFRQIGPKWNSLGDIGYSVLMR